MSDKKGLLIFAPNVGFGSGKWMISNFMLSILTSSHFRDGGEEVFLVSRGAKDDYQRKENIHLYTVASNFSVEPFDKYGLQWSGKYRLPMAQAIWNLLRDSMKVTRMGLSLLPRVRTAFWWTEPLVPFGTLLQTSARLRGVRRVFTLANYQRTRPLHDLSLKVALAGYDHLVTPSHALSEHLVGVGFPKNKLATIPLGVPLAHFRPPSLEEKARIRREYDVKENARVVLWAGPIIPPSRMEDVHFFLESIPEIRKKAPDTIFLFVFKYGVPPGLEPPDPGVRFLNQYQSFRDILHMADVLALPFTASHLWITTPLSVMEAQACGVPVVTVRRPGLTELIEDRKSGTLVDQLEQFPGAVSELCADDALRHWLAQGAREQVEAKFDINDVAERYHRLLLGE